MLDALPAAERPARRRAPGALRTVDPEAYDEPRPALYVYRLRRGDDEHVGVVGDVRAEAFARRPGARARGGAARAGSRASSSTSPRPRCARSWSRCCTAPGPRSTRRSPRRAVAAPVLHFTGPGRRGSRPCGGCPTAAATVLCRRAEPAACTTSPTATTGSPPAWRLAAARAEPPDAGLMCVDLPDRRPAAAGVPPQGHGPRRTDELLALLAAGVRGPRRRRPRRGDRFFGVYVEGSWYDVIVTGAPADGPRDWTSRSCTTGSSSPARPRRRTRASGSRSRLGPPVDRADPGAATRTAAPCSRCARPL